MAAIPWDTNPDRRRRKPDESKPRTAVGKIILGRMVIRECPFCGETHRYRRAVFGSGYVAHCGGQGGIIAVRDDG